MLGEDVDDKRERADADGSSSECSICVAASALG
ncbi:hypothetical protein PC116_g22557 [Phytophthora cactorum]|nr:hypothetical protein PC119_g19689 [Phytophthora cactorum]KAG3138824.1 hypothetical protein C6341_g20551 [Phytophthora cactorum]KAG4229104.1 hypothetical protein PC116_g22557 [Phytophthora cactorum]